MGKNRVTLAVKTVPVPSRAVDESVSNPYVKLTAAMPTCAAIFKKSQKMQARITPTCLVRKTSLLSSVKLSAFRMRSSFSPYQSLDSRRGRRAYFLQIALPACQNRPPHIQSHIFERTCNIETKPESDARCSSVEEPLLGFRDSPVPNCKASSQDPRSAEQ